MSLAQLNSLDTVHNRFVLISFLSFTTLYVYCYFKPLNNAINAFAMLFSFIIGILPFLFQKKCTQTRFTQSLKSDLQNNADQEIIRTSMYRKLIGNNKITLLFGDSGCGKTVLLKQLISVLKEKDVQLKLREDGYYASAVPADYEGCDYIIFDQFERAIISRKVKKWIDVIKSLKKQGAHIIIALRKEYVGDFFTLFDQTDIIPIILTNQDVEKEKVLSLIEENMGNKAAEKIGDDTKDRIFLDFNNSRITFIQFSLIREYLLSDNGPLKLETLTYHQLIKNYLLETIEKSGLENTLVQILYLLSLNSTSYFTIHDFENITFVDPQCCITALQFLEERRWVMKINQFQAGKESREEYKIAHDYYQECFRGICSERITAETRSNIENYFYLFTENLNNQENHEDFTADKNKYYKKNITNPRVFLHVSLYGFLVLYAAINYFFLNTIKLQNNCHAFEMALLQIAEMLSVVYVYNFYYRFIAILDKSFVFYPALMICAFCDLASLIYNSYWGVFLGAGVITTGFVIGSVRMLYLKTNNETFFLTRSRNYIIMGIIIVYLGIIYHICVNQNPIYGIVFILLYIIYMIATIISHMKDSHFMLLIGKVLFHR